MGKGRRGVCIRKGKKLLRGQQTVLGASITHSDDLELIPDPEDG